MHRNRQIRYDGSQTGTQILIYALDPFQGIIKSRFSDLIVPWWNQ